MGAIRRDARASSRTSLERCRDQPFREPPSSSSLCACAGQNARHTRMFMIARTKLIRMAGNGKYLDCQRKCSRSWTKGSREARLCDEDTIVPAPPGYDRIVPTCLTRRVNFAAPKCADVPFPRSVIEATARIRARAPAGSPPIAPVAPTRQLNTPERKHGGRNIIRSGVAKAQQATSIRG